MHHSQTKDLFQLQTELIDMKVDMAASNAMDRAITQLSDLIHNEVQGLRADMNARFSAVDARFSSIDTRLLSVDSRLSSVENRLVAVETKLGIKNVTNTEIRTRLLDYSFKATSAIVGGAVMYVIILIHALIK